MENKQFGFSQLLLAATVVVAVILVIFLIYPRAGRQIALKEFPASAPQMAVTPEAVSKAAQHFHPKGKMPSRFTVELQNGLRK
ncbi:MAG TPA: hypothetical protein DEH25_11795, partial [Chloroflexi bacterium]|nr:hypothetical protein [Chloroflexota bacterium]